MDNINPLLAMGARGVGGAVGANNTGRLDNSQQAQAKRQEQHRQVLAKQASDLGMVDLAKSIMTGDVPNEVAMKAIMAQKQADAQANADTNAAQAAHKETLRKEGVASDLYDQKREDKLTDDATKREQDLADARRREAHEIQLLIEEHGYEEGLKKAKEAKVKKEERAELGKVMKAEAEYAQNIKTDVQKLKVELKDAYTGRLGQAASIINPAGDTGSAQFTLDQIKAKLTKSSMDSFRAQSSTGSTGFGALSEKELKVLQDQIANLSITMGDEKLEEQLDAITAKMDKAINNYQTEFAVELEDDVRNEALGLEVGPKEGETEGGYTFTGGDPKDPANWSAK
tara:strand:- start:9523 stop:10548 length:1026 start_codon:yes stop_codon:yes gene_type:complete